MQPSRLLAIVLFITLGMLYVYANTAFWWTVGLIVLGAVVIVCGRIFLGVVGLAWFVFIVLDTLDKRRR